MALVEDAPSAKRLKLGEPRPDLTAEQKAIVERNRQLALARRGERMKIVPETSSAATSATVSEQQERIRRNREAALLRKRQREADSGRDDQDVLQSSQGLERKHEEMAPLEKSMVTTEMADDQPATDAKDAGETNREALPEQRAEKEQEPPPLPCEETPKSMAEDPSEKEVHEDDQTTEEGQAKSEDEDGDEESSGFECELTSGSCSSSEETSDSDTSETSSDSDSLGEGEEEEDIVEDVEDPEHEDVENEDKQDEEDGRKEEEEDKEEKEEEDEEEAPVNWDLRRSARPQNEPPCCTQRWEPVQLKAFSASGEAIPPKSRELRSAKQSLVAKLLCRWWYVLPDWPPSDFDYTGALAERGYRCVAVSDFEAADEMEGNLRKVFALPNGYKGLYRDESGAVIDVRPVEGRPSYDQLMCRSHAELHELLLLAYTRQLEVLESKSNGGEAERALKQQLRLELKQAKNSLFKFGSIGAKQ